MYDFGNVSWSLGKYKFFQMLTYFIILYQKIISILTTKLIRKDLEALDAVELTVIYVFQNSNFCLKARILFLAKEQFLSVFLELAGSSHSFLRKYLPNI